MNLQSAHVNIYPVQVAYRGFRYGLPIDWIYGNIEQALKEGLLKRPPYLLWPEDKPLSVAFTRKLLEGWKRQYDAGGRIDVPEELWMEIDRILGVHARRAGVDTSEVSPGSSL